MKSISTQDLPGFCTPPNHVDFLAKKFPELAGTFQGGALAYLAPGGGGPTQKHTHHTHDHLFLVIQGEACIEFETEKIIVKANESFRVPGTRPHSVWNYGTSTAIMLGLTIASRDKI